MSDVNLEYKPNTVPMYMLRRALDRVVTELGPISLRKLIEIEPDFEHASDQVVTIDYRRGQIPVAVSSEIDSLHVLSIERERDGAFKSFIGLILGGNPVQLPGESGPRPAGYDLVVPPLVDNDVQGPFIANLEDNAPRDSNGIPDWRQYLAQQNAAGLHPFLLSDPAIIDLAHGLDRFTPDDAAGEL